MNNISDNNFNSLIADLRRTLSWDTTPDGDLSAALNGVLQIASDMGFHTQNLDNKVGYIDLNRAATGTLYGIMCHLDTVPVGDLSKWSHNPFAGEIHDGKLYGRGTIDDKGPLIASLYAMKVIKDSGVTLNNRFRLIVGTDEEGGGFTCIKRYKLTEEIPVVNAEKGLLRCKITKRGDGDNQISINGGIRTNMVPDHAVAIINGEKIETVGVSAHAMVPEKGKNAIQALLKILAERDYSPKWLKSFLDNVWAYLKMETDGLSLGIACRDEISGALTCNLGVISATESSCVIDLNIRHPVTADGEAIIARLRGVADQLEATLEVDYVPPLYVPADTPFVQTLISAYEEVTGEKGHAVSTGGGTYCREMPNSVSFGMAFPNEEEMAHQIDEYVYLDSLRTAVNIYVAAITKMSL